MDANNQLKILNARLKSFTEAYNNFKALGIDEDLLVGYIVYKTKLSKKQVLLVIQNQEVFYNKLLSKLTLDSL